MNIGITNWREGRTSYPLDNTRSLIGFIADASFIVRDDFVPSLDTVEMGETNVTLTFTLDDGAFYLVIDNADVVEGAKFVLRRADRYHGVIVLGAAATDVRNLVFGDVIEPKAKFNGAVLRTINTKNGVHSINGLRGDVVLNTGTDIFHSGTSLNAVSMPNNVEQLQLEANTITVQTEDTNLYSVALTWTVGAATTAVLTNLHRQTDRNYVGITQIGDELIGSIERDNAQSFYSLNTLPSSLLFTNIDSTADSCAATSDHTLYAYNSETNVVYKYGVAPYNTLLARSCDAGVQIFSRGANLYLLQNGVQSYATGNNFSASTVRLLTYSGSTLTTSQAGILADYTLTHPNALPWLTHIVELNNMLYGFASVANEYWLYEIDPSSYQATKIAAFDKTLLTTPIKAIFVSGTSITINPITPLTSINGLIANANSINLTGSDTVFVTTKNNNTLQVGLRIPDDTLNVNRTQHYE